MYYRVYSTYTLKEFYSLRPLKFKLSEKTISMSIEITKLSLTLTLVP